VSITLRRRAQHLAEAREEPGLDAVIGMAAEIAPGTQIGFLRHSLRGCRIGREIARA